MCRVQRSFSVPRSACQSQPTGSTQIYADYQELDRESVPERIRHLVFGRPRDRHSLRMKKNTFSVLPHQQFDTFVAVTATD